MIDEKNLIEVMRKAKAKESDRNLKGLIGWFIELIEVCPKVGSKWIPVSERLPELNSDVLCYKKTWKGYEIFVGKYRDADKMFDHPYFDWKQNGFPTVLAWQPLPEPYKGE